jgi:hypothetical protein
MKDAQGKVEKSIEPPRSRRNVAEGTEKNGKWLR